MKESQVSAGKKDFLEGWKRKACLLNHFHGRREVERGGHSLEGLQFQVEQTLHHPEKVRISKKK